MNFIVSILCVFGGFEALARESDQVKAHKNVTPVPLKFHQVQTKASDKCTRDVDIADADAKSCLQPFKCDGKNYAIHYSMSPSKETFFEGICLYSTEKFESDLEKNSAFSGCNSMYDKDDLAHAKKCFDDTVKRLHLSKADLDKLTPVMFPYERPTGPVQERPVEAVPE